MFQRAKSLRECSGVVSVFPLKPVIDLSLLTEKLFAIYWHDYDCAIKEVKNYTIEDIIQNKSVAGKIRITLSKATYDNDDDVYI